MKLVRYQHPLADSFSEFDRWFRSPAAGFGRLFELADRFSETGSAGFGYDLYEDDENYFARLELPGVKKDDLKVELHDHTLTIVYDHEKKGDSENEERAVLKRVVTVPDGIDAEKVGAKLEDGILTVTLPKSAERKPRQIKVN
ncbi:MAG: Hsp20/alpha crystallin family protein [Verrucomicrobiae bacterium]|nr:Hsp20/alpha crystallin family protein [Verrucomicrobiae bacterium]